MRITSSAFDHEGFLPERYTCDGDGVSPPLTIHDVPSSAVTLVLVMEDPDAPAGVWDHWIAFDIPTDVSIPEAVTSLGTSGRNTSGGTGYDSPCPPSGTHRYILSVFALDTRLGLPPGAGKTEILQTLSGHVLEEATLMGRYGGHTKP